MTEKSAPGRPAQILGTNVTQLHGYASFASRFRQPERKLLSGHTLIGTIKNRDAIFKPMKSIAAAFMQASTLTAE